MFFENLCVALEYFEDFSCLFIYIIILFFYLQSKMWKMLQTLQFAFVSVIDCIETLRYLFKFAR